MELKDTVVGGRFDSALTKVPLNELLDQQEMIMDMIQDVEGTLIIKEYPTKSASVQTIRGHVDRLIKKGMKPDMILVDYADLLRPTRSTGEKTRT